MLLFFNAPHIQKLKIEMGVLCFFSVLLIDAFYSLLSFPWLYIFSRRYSFFPSFFPSPPVPLGVMIDDQPYVETHDSTCSP